jgi:plasmid stabilization system protein ParE
MLAAHPLVGGRIDNDLRELVMSFGKSGYVALYRFVPHLDMVRVLAIRHQRELDYPQVGATHETRQARAFLKDALP